MAIAYSSQGAGASTATNGAALSVACPATVNAGDLLIAHVAWNDTSSAPSTPANWTLLDGPRDIGTTPNGRHWIFGKIADGTEDGASISFGTAGGTAKRWGRIYRFTGGAGGTIAQLVKGFSGTSHATDPQMPSVTTTQAGGLAVACVAQNDDNAVAAATGMSGGTWAEAVAEFTATTGGGVMMQIQTCTPTANPGTVSGGSASTSNDPCGVIGFDIEPTAIASGSLAPTDGLDVAALAGDVDVKGPLAATDAADVAAVAGDVIAQGTLGPTETGDTLAATGTVEDAGAITGTLAAVEAEDGLAAGGDVIVQGAAGLLEAPDSASLAGDVMVTGALAAMSAADTASLNGTVPKVATGTLAAAEAQDVAALAGQTPSTGILAAQEMPDHFAAQSADRHLGPIPFRRVRRTAPRSWTKVDIGVTSQPLVAPPMSAASAPPFAEILAALVRSAPPEIAAPPAPLSPPPITTGALTTSEAPDTAAAVGDVRFSAEALAWFARQIDREDELLLRGGPLVAA